MTWADLIARGRGTPAFAFVVDGCKYVAGTHSAAPTDAWYTGEGYSYLQGLKADSLTIGCGAHPAEVWPETESMDVVVEDKTGTLLSYLLPLEQCVTTRLAQTVTAAATTLAIADFAYLPAGLFDVGDDIHVNQETMRVTALAAAPNLCTVTRGYYGSTARQHVVDLGLVPSCEPIVAAGPGDLLGRRCRLYAGEVVNGVLSAMTQVWVGYVYAAPTYGMRRVTIPVQHVVHRFRTGEVLGFQATGQLRGLYVPNYGPDPHTRWGRLVFRDWGLLTTDVVDVVADGSATFYETTADLVDAVNAAVLAAAVPLVFDCHGAGGRIRARYTGAGGADVSLGGSAGLLSGLLGWVNDAGVSYEATFTDYTEAPYPPAHTFAWLRRELGFYPRLYLRDGEASRFVAGLQVRLETDGDPVELRHVSEVNAVDDYITVSEAGAAFSGTSWPDQVLLRADEPPPAVRQIWRLDCDIPDAVRALWTGTLYTGSRSVVYTIPVDWLPGGPTLSVDDVDWPGLRELCDGLVPACLSRITCTIEEPTEVDDILGAALFAAGLYAAVGADGTVEWHRARVPSAGEADASIDGGYLVATRAPSIEPELGADGVLNAVKLIIPDTAESWAEETFRPLYIYSRDSLQRYGRHAPKLLLKNARELKLPMSLRTAASTPALEQAIARHMASSTLGLMSRPRLFVTLPTALRGRAFAVGDVVLLTTPWLWDLAAQAAGVTDKLAIVVGWRRALGYQGEDELRLMVIDEDFGVIAPAALATSWHAATRTLAFADTDRYHLDRDASDLSHFEAGDDVRLHTYDSEAPGSWVAKLESVSVAGGTVVLTADPFGGAFPAGAVMTFADYTTCGADQQGEGWVWLADDADGRVQDARAGWQWST